MAPLPPELLDHPGVQASLALIPAALLGSLASWQAGQLGLGDLTLPGMSRFRWPGFFGIVTFWLTLVTAVLMFVSSAPAAVWEILEALIRLLLGGVALMLANVAQRSLEDQASSARDDASKRSLTGASAAALVVGLAAAVLVLVDGVGLIFGLIVLALCAWYLAEPKRRSEAKGWLQNLRGGLALRQMDLKIEDRLLDGRQIVALPGVFATWVADDESRQLVPNRDMLTLIANKSQPDASADANDGSPGGGT